jgi:hypothetical protein
VHTDDVRPFQAYGQGDDDLLQLVVEIRGYRREDAKDKKATTA